MRAVERADFSFSSGREKRIYGGNFVVQFFKFLPNEREMIKKKLKHERIN